MKQPNAEKPWVCQFCGTVKEQEAVHLNSHRHKTNMKKIEDAMAGEPLRQPADERRWTE